MSFLKKTACGNLIMNQVSVVHVPYSRRSCRGLYAVVATETGHGLTFLNIILYIEKDVVKMESFPLHSMVAVDYILTPNGRKKFVNISKATMTTCSKCYCFTPTDEQVTHQCVKETKQERIGGVWLLKSFHDYKMQCPWIPDGFSGRRVTFEQHFKTMVYESYFETPFFDELSTLKIGQSVLLSGWMDTATLKPARYFTNVVPF